MLVALEGIDGSGKTSVCQLICKGLQEAGVNTRFIQKSSPETRSPYVTQQLSKLREVIWPADDGSDHHQLGDDYWLYLMAAWFAAVQENRFQFEHDTNSITVYDGWYYRFVLKFMNKGYDERWLFSLFSRVREPELTVLLDVDPTIAWSRRILFKEPEVGRSDGHKGGAFDSYCFYQNAIRSRLRELATLRQWHVIEQAKESDAGAIAAELVPSLLKRFRNPRSATSTNC